MLLHLPTRRRPPSIPPAAACGKSALCSSTELFGRKCGSNARFYDYVALREKENIITKVPPPFYQAAGV